MGPDATATEYLALVEDLIALEQRNVEGHLSDEERARWCELNEILFGARRHDRRQFFRVEAARTASIVGPAGASPAEVTSISAAGLFLRTTDAVPGKLGEQLDIELALPLSEEKALRARVEVCRVVPAGGELTPGLGVRFVNLTGSQQQLLLEYLRAHLKWLVELSREKYRFFFQHSADLAVLLTARGRIREVNDAGAALLGRSAADVVDQSLDGLVLSDLAEPVRRALDAAGKGERVHIALAFPAASGELVPVDAAISVLEVGGLRYGTMLIGHDRRMRQQLEEQQRILERRLFQTDKLATLGQVTAGIAHDINNPLGYVHANLSVLREHVEPLLELVHAARLLGTASPVRPELLARIEAELGELVEDSLEGSRRIWELVRDLHDFSRLDGAEEVRIDVNDCLEAGLRVTRNLLRHRARVQRELAVDLPPTYGNFGRLSHVFLNLLNNAVQAFSHADLDHNVVLVSTRHEEGRIVIRITDNGRGIPPEATARIFEPFFTTRRSEGGTGLGLAIAKESTEALGGTLSVDSAPGRGSTFTVTLPVLRPSRFVPPPEPRMVPPPRAIRVLLVDDDALLLRSLQRGLERHFSVTVSTSSRSALRLAEAGAFDAILCDVMMPELSGIDLVERLAATRPDLARRVVFMTGGVFALEEQRSLARLTNVVLRKPVELDQVVETIAAMGAPSER